MYLFLSYLSFVEICYCSVTAPKLILDSLMEESHFPQGLHHTDIFLHFFGGTEIFLLTLMAPRPLRGHLQAPALHGRHEPKGVWPPWWGGVGWGLAAFCRANLPHFPAALMWPQGPRPLLL